MSALNSVWYAVRDENFEDVPVADDEWLSARRHGYPRDLTHLSEWRVQCLAAELAEDYWSNHDGWEADWPLTIIIGAGPEGPEVARVSVDAQQTTRFSGRFLARDGGGDS